MIHFHSGEGLDPDVKDALCEINNVGVGKATSALGKMINQRILIRTPEICAVSANLDDFIKKNAEKMCMGILMRLGSEFSGVVLIAVEQRLMRELVSKISGIPYTPEQLLTDENCLSAVHEIANIMAASYMTAIGAYTGLRIYLTPVMIGADILSGLVSDSEQALPLDRKSCICIDTQFHVQDENNVFQDDYHGSILMFPDEGSIDVLMKALLG